MRLSLKQPSGPKYVHLADKLREQIQREYPPGSRFPTMSELREAHSVSISTMERAYSLLEQEGLILREQGRGTFVLSPPSKPTYVVAVSPRLFPDQQKPYWFDLLNGVNAGARDNRVEVIFSAHDYRSIWERADGMIVSHEPLSNFGQPPRDFPFVSLIGPVEGADCVLADDHSGVYQLTEHLIELGHRRIALLYAYGPGSAVVDERYRGYRDALRDHGIPYDETRIRTQSPVDDAGQEQPHYPESGYRGMQQWLRSGWTESGCTAIIAYNDGMAVGIIRALNEAGLRVPEDVSVAGFDGTQTYEYLRPRLTTIHVPLQGIGRAGLDVLLKRLRGEPGVPALTQLPVNLVVRESTAPPS